MHQTNYPMAASTFVGEVDHLFRIHFRQIALGLLKRQQARCHVLVIVICGLFLSGCGVYSFTGASISPEVKSVSIAFFPSYAALAPANMPQLFTEELRDKFVNQTNLDLLKENGDIRFEGFISDYRTQPVAIQGNSAAKNRLTVSVNVTYTDTKNEEGSFEKTFTRFADFDATVNLVDVEQTLILEINEQIIQDIFNQSVVNW